MIVIGNCVNRGGDRVVIVQTDPSQSWQNMTVDEARKLATDLLDAANMTGPYAEVESRVA